jgi:uncharacterized membrane protein YdbT with pleckstrin-like domain
VQTHSGEHIIFEGHPSWRSVLDFYVKGLALTVAAGGIAALVTLVAGDEVNWATAALVAIAVLVIVLVVGFVKRMATTYSISNQRLHIRRGIVARKIKEARLERVQNVNTSQSVLERILQVGTVDFDTAGTTDSDFSFRGVAQPEKVMAAVDQAQREHAAAARELGDPEPRRSEPSPSEPPPPT